MNQTQSALRQKIRRQILSLALVGMLFSSAAANPQDCDGSVRPPETQVPVVQTDTRVQTDTQVPAVQNDSRVPAVQHDTRLPEAQNNGLPNPGAERGFNPQPDPPGQPAGKGEL